MVPPGATRRFFQIGAASALFFVAAQVFQLVVNRVVPGEGSGLDAEVAQLVSGPVQARQILILASLFALPAAFGAVAWARRREAPFAAFFGFVFGLIFVIAELLYRGIELVLVTRRWGIAYLGADAAARSTLGARIQAWHEFVAAWYFVLLTAHLLASLCFLAATTKPRDAWDRALQFVFALNAVRLVLRLSGAFADLPLAAQLSGTLYFPAMFAIFGTIAVWLAREARRTPD